MRRQPTEAQRRAAMAKRIALGKLSDAIRPLVKAGMYSNVNEGLEELYRQETGQVQFCTFAGWKAAGYLVCKGMTGYPVWSTPMELGKGAPDEPAADAEESANSAESKPVKAPGMVFRMAYLFHAGQVRDASGNHPASFKAAEQLAMEPMAATA